MSKLCIGLFGTCGDSQWREPFVNTYNDLGIIFYNPQVDDWTPDCAVEEAEHLANDRIILLPITSETYGFGSLSEVGFSLLNAIRLDDRRDFVTLIDLKLDTDLMKDKAQAKESLNSRALVYQHLKKLRLPNLYLVEDLNQMLSVSVLLWKAAKIHQAAGSFDRIRG